jgi:GNAT superfamily N-acetyltransferase
MITVRRATAQDIETLASLRMEFMRETGSLQDETIAPSLFEATLKYLTAKLPQEQYAAWLAEAESRTPRGVGAEAVAISGVALLERPPTPSNPSGLEGYIVNIYTRPAWRSQGLGSHMLALAIDYLKERGARRAWLRATAVGQRLYERAGFVPINAETEARGILQMELRW